MKRSHIRMGAALAAAALITGLAACSPSTKESSDEMHNHDHSHASEPMQSGEGAAPGEDAGFDEFPLGDEVFVGPLTVAGVYFQPVEMEPAMGTPASEASMHMEADIAAAPNNKLGYGAGDFIPGLTVDYRILGEGGKVVQEGTFMPMVASDGPHYGINLPKLEAGTYTVQFIIKSPEESGWMLHTDKATGVEGRYWTEPLVAEFTNWQWDPTAVEW
ncbi:iron transporter [Schaalia sp. ZJ405]|uniref:iron transporter n=1 Tax=unclassified Schaalia TaxID=2691889 RepID=UPI0013EB332A|nr:MULTISPECIES: iron transporter [unclassified Schaalia]QPK81530.1 iron transporter [Schaalia sp. ZJ405]